MEIALQIVIIFLGLYIAFFKKYFEAYFVEKGKALATKEDIEEITKKVKSVKSDFSKEIEHFRGTLFFKNTVKGIMYSDKKESIIKLYEALHLWFETIDNHLISALEYDQEKLNTAEQEIENSNFMLQLRSLKLNYTLTMIIFLIYFMNIGIK